KYKYPYPLATEPDPLHFLQLQFAGQGGRGHLSALDVLLHCQPKTFLTLENYLLSLEASRRMLLILLAAGQFRAEQGTYPPSLAALVPDYLPELLIDPFTQQ